MPDAVPMARNRADLCRFLAACYYEPTQLFVDEKLFDSMAAAAAGISAELAASAHRLGELFSSERLEELLLDYSRLFLGPNNILAQPYGSVWLDQEKKLMQDSTVQVLELYKEGGFELSEDFRELPDHIAAELEFLYLLRIVVVRKRERVVAVEPAVIGVPAISGFAYDQHLRSLRE